VPFVFKVRDSGLGSLLVFISSVLLHGFLMFYTVLFSPEWMNDDATRLYFESLDICSSGGFHWGIGANLYENFMAVLNCLLGSSILLPQALNIFLFSLSMVLILQINNFLNQGRYPSFILFIFSFSLMTLIMTSQPMREAYQMFFLMLFAYFMVRLHFGKGALDFILAMVALFMLAISHKMLLVYSFCLFGLLFVWQFNNRKPLISMHLLLLAVLLLSVFFIMAEHVFSGGIFGVITSKGVVHAINDYRDILLIGRASYHLNLDDTSLLMLLVSFMKIVVYYFLMPFPWVVRSLGDVYAFLEVIVRVILIYYSIVAIKEAYGQRRRAMLLLFFIYISVNIFWSVGVGNYGTGLRHFVISSWIVVLLGGGRLCDSLLRCRMRK